MTSTKLSAFQRTCLSLGAQVWFPLGGNAPWTDKIGGQLLTGGTTFKTEAIGPNGVQASTNTSTTEDKTGTILHLNGVTELAMMFWVYRTTGGSWADTRCKWYLDFLQASGRGGGIDARTSPANGYQIVKSSSATAYWQKVTSTSTVPLNTWVLIGGNLNISVTATAPLHYTDGLVDNGSGGNNGFTQGTMDASVAAVIGSMAGNWMKDCIMIPRALSALEFGALSRMGPFV